jgi:hypothetical protein
MHAKEFISHTQKNTHTKNKIKLNNVNFLIFGDGLKF